MENHPKLCLFSCFVIHFSVLYLHEWIFLISIYTIPWDEAPNNHHRRCCFNPKQYVLYTKMYTKDIHSKNLQMIILSTQLFICLLSLQFICLPGKTLLSVAAEPPEGHHCSWCSFLLLNWGLVIFQCDRHLPEVIRNILWNLEHFLTSRTMRNVQFKN